MQIVPEIPGWSIPGPPTTLPGDEPFVLFAMETMIARLQPDSAAIQRVIDYLANKYAINQQDQDGWSNYYTLRNNEYASATAMRGSIAGE
ncbi:MAG: hypothetical protein GY774_35655 [Planctomycetes bacterium]|nr:hypothetical protein [Planctomycetota bacterium]